MDERPYSAIFQKKIAQYVHHYPKFLKADHCRFCGGLCGQGSVTDSKHSADSIFNKSPLTCGIIFPLNIKECKKACGRCWNHVQSALLEKNEFELMVLISSAVRKKFVQPEPIIEPTNEIAPPSPKITEIDQSKLSKEDNATLLRILNTKAHKIYPSQLNEQVTSLFHVGVTSDNQIKIMEEPDYTEKFTNGRGRPPISPATVDVGADMCAEALTSSQGAVLAKKINDKHFVGMFTYKDQPFCKTTVMKCLAIKAFSSDWKLVKWAAEQEVLFVGFDGGGTDERKFFEFHLIGICKKQVTKMHLITKETITSTTGKELGELFVNEISRLIGFAIKQKVKITTLLSIHGLTYDTTSENTGPYGGICAVVTSHRKFLWNQVQEKLPIDQRSEYQDLIMCPCCDHVSMLFLVHWLKTLVEWCLQNGYARFVKGDRMILLPMFESIGNLLAGPDGQLLSAKIVKDIKDGKMKSDFTGTFQKFDKIRYLSLGNLLEKVFEFEDYINDFMAKSTLAKSLTQVQNDYWMMWKTEPLQRGIAKLVVLAKRDYMAPMMKTGNHSHSLKVWQNMIKTKLEKATEMKHARCHKLADEVSNSFAYLNLSPEKLSAMQTGLRSANRLLGEAIIFMIKKWYEDLLSVSTGPDGKDLWIVATNREAERYISILKYCLGLSPNISEVIINAYMRLRGMDFCFASEIPEKRYAWFIKKGTSLYNGKKTQLTIKLEKKVKTDAKLELDIQKTAQTMRGERIFQFIVDCGAPLQPKLSKKGNKPPKMNPTNDNVKDFILKMQRHGKYTSNDEMRNKESLYTIMETHFLPKGPASFNGVYTTQ